MPQRNRYIVTVSSINYTQAFGTPCINRNNIFLEFCELTNKVETWRHWMMPYDSPFIAWLGLSRPSSLSLLQSTCSDHWQSLSGRTNLKCLYSTGYSSTTIKHYLLCNTDMWSQCSIHVPVTVLSCHQWHTVHYGRSVLTCITCLFHQTVAAYHITPITPPYSHYMTFPVRRVGFRGYVTYINNNFRCFGKSCSRHHGDQWV